MKKVIGILAVVAFASSIASAELLKNVQYSGSVEVKSVTTDNYPGFDKDLKNKHSETMPRVILGINFDLNDDVNAQVTAAKLDRQYGDTSTAGQTIDNATSVIVFSEAYLNLKNVIGINHKVGRMHFGNPGDIVVYFGPSPTAVAAFSVSALDAWYGEWTKDKWTVAALMGKVVENSQTAMRDSDVYGVTAAYDYSEIVKTSVYVYQLDDRIANVKADKPNVAGVKVTGKYQGVGYGAEFAMNSGNSSTVDYTGNAMKADVDYSLDVKTAGKFEFMGGYAMGSGNDDSIGTADKTEGFKAINHNYVPGLLFSGVGMGAAQADGLTNLTTFNLGANWTPEKLNKLTVGAKFFNFAYTSDKVTGVTDKPIGTELDFTATWNHSDNVGLTASYAMFTPDQKFAGAGNPTDAATLLGFDLAVKF
ncbi:MAG: alginate export family protein [Elusimicrobia bacterium]|nr:alginate export family protein [Elusimicrobiota bacterium]